MSTTLQLVVVGGVVAFAAGYVLRAMWKTWFGASKPGCGSGCGKCATSDPEPEVKGRRPLPMA
ncbi:FeoB-associated Cys-rich membrane protein [Gemmata sp. SH-PL17]|uniref:FeoB-associated Cys-rich membrane protein n=1 Tax=Gemmata sp. SH-PL17 TaxID=1630693 RepID=UPI001390089D|nr:FeoB-associated Cys-rich membrane protein [Gemmata sp. SH-PL17]